MKNKEPPFKSAKGKLIPYLDLIKKRINHLDFDSFVVICGNERLGKSTLAAQLGMYITDGKLSVDNICMTTEEFLKQLKETKKGDTIIFDEAGTALYSREAMTTMNRMLTKAFMVSGLKNICIILCIPDFFSLDSYVRMHRINLLLYVVKRGRYLSYSKKRAKGISLKGSKMKNVRVVKSLDYGWFPKQFPKELEEAYRKKERAYKFSFIGSIKDNLEGNYNTSKFAEITGYNLKTVMRWIEDKKINAKKVGGRWWIPKQEAEKIVEEQREAKGWVKKE